MTYRDISTIFVSVLKTNKKPHKNPILPPFLPQTQRVFVLSTSNFLIRIIQIITENLGGVSADSYLDLFSPFIQKYCTLFCANPSPPNTEVTHLKCNLNEVILLRVRNRTQQLFVL